MNAAWRTRYEVAVEAARQAGRLALGFFPDGSHAPFTLEWKSDNSPVTNADRQAETHLRSTLLGAFPADGFLGEEFGEQPGSSGYRWIIDPIDGTRSFVRGVPIWGTLVGLEYRGEQIAGVVAVPSLGQTFRALRGDGAFRDDQPIRVSMVGTLAEAHLFYSSVSWFVRAGRHDAFLQLAARTERQRGFGDFYGFVLVAQGSGEAMIDTGTHPWDVAGIKVIIEEARGRFTDWDGTATINRPDVVASNGRLHDIILQELRKTT
jgi:histidinol-phosphatase